MLPVCVCILLGVAAAGEALAEPARPRRLLEGGGRTAAAAPGLKVGRRRPQPATFAVEAGEDAQNTATPFGAARPGTRNSSARGARPVLAPVGTRAAADGGAASFLSQHETVTTTPRLKTYDPHWTYARLRDIYREVEAFPRACHALWKSNVQFLRMMLPGMKLRTSSTHAVPLIIVSSLAWLSFYFTRIYTYDREECLEAAAIKVEGASSQLRNTDFVIVFHHPSYDYQDGNKYVSAAMVEDVLLYHKELAEGTRRIGDSENVAMYHQGDAEPFSALRAFLDDVGGRGPPEESDPERSDPESSQPLQMFTPRSSRQLLVSAVGSLKEIKKAVGSVKLDKTMAEARTTLIQDLFRCLPSKMGFDVKIFSSVDYDELFLTVSLNKKWAEHYITQSNMELQITHPVVKALGIVQDPDDPRSSPPYVRYDRRLVKNLYRASAITDQDERLLYRMFHDREPEGSVLSSTQRIDVILREFAKCLDLEAAKTAGMVVDWYPVHSELWLRKLQETWVDKTFSCDFSQPIPLLKEYFGSQIAFNFAWQGLYIKGLIALSVVVLVVEMIKVLPPILFDEVILNNRVMLPFSLVLAVWARVMVNLWEREEAYFVQLWDMKFLHDHRYHRPAFRGKLMKSDVDEKIMEADMPHNEKLWLRASSICITLGCCCFVMFVISVWVFLHKGNLDLGAQLALSAFVKISEVSYNVLSAKLAEMENHKHEDTFHDSWVWQQYMFQAVNSYWACIAMALTQLWLGRCPEIGCLESLKLQMSMLMLILLSCSIGFCFLEWFLVRAHIFQEDLALEKQVGKEEASQRKTQRSFLEEQAKFSTFGTKEQIENTLQLVLGLGFVLLFGTLQPLVVPFCTLHFIVTLRARAVLLTQYTQRCVPHKLLGIGAWKPVVDTLMNLGIFFSGFLLVYWGRFFQGGTLIARLTGMILWFALIFVVRGLVDFVVPAKSKDAHVMERRRRYVNQVITETSMDSQFNDDDADGDPDSPCSPFSRTSTPGSNPEMKEDAPIQRREVRLNTRFEGGKNDKCARLVETEDWSNIPMFDGTPKEKPESTTRKLGQLGRSLSRYPTKK